MKRINVLTTDTSNKIAAGEVVERPCSVVKELVENSIDAGARNIVIEIVDGGQKSIKIVDDGYGIHPDDVQKAFLPHATSKIQSAEDIFNITTLGFRGEALPSIAAVSHTTLKSRSGDFSSGKEISITGGIINYINDTALNTGTVIEIKDLFYNVPARLKFLKSPIREAALISDLVSRISLSNPDISFKLFNNDKKVLQTYGNGNLADCLRSIYGRNVFDSLIYFEKYGDKASVHGYIGNADLSRGSRNNQTIFVNKRYVKSKLMTAAVETAFKSFVTVNKYPFFVLFLDIFPEFVDVNIHPTKSEIKFRDDREIFKIVFDCVHNAMKNNLKDTFDVVNEPEENYSTKEVYENISYFNDSFSEGKKETATDAIDLPIDLKVNKTYEEIGRKTEYTLSPSPVDEYRYTDKIPAAPVTYKPEADKYTHTEAGSENTNGDTLQKFERLPKFPELNVIGQFQKTYILAQAGAELYIIDQHAAHEKIIFEKYMKEIEKGSIAVQVLLTPAILELSLDDYCYFQENTEVFEKVGFAVEIFGDNTITIREVPYVLGSLDIKNFFLSIIDNLRNMGSGKTTAVKYNSIARLACKSAVKANHVLSEVEINALVQELRFAEDPYNCPHGRPTIVKITQTELEKRFKRIV